MSSEQDSNTKGNVSSGQEHTANEVQPNAGQASSRRVEEDDQQSLITKLQNELEQEKKKGADLSKRLLYLQADYANLQRQSERRIEDAKDGTRLRFIEELISVKEDLERAMSVARASSVSPLYDGLRMLLSRLDGTLRGEEVERISVSSGSVFDPRLHEAVAYSEGGSEKEDGTVLSVVSNGYTMRGKVIKPALVEVARQNRPPVAEPHVEDAMEPELSNVREKKACTTDSEIDRGI